MESTKGFSGSSASVPLRTAGGLVLLAAAATATGCIHTRIRPTDVDTSGGFSVGAPNFGFLVQARRLSGRGAGYEVLRSPSQGGQHYGTARLVQAIERAARSVRRRAGSGAPLRVGDLSARQGGRIPHHNSHRSGRDADLLFFARDATGASVPAPGFVRYNAAGESVDPEHPLAFDTARNWQLVESLARDDDAAVIRIFCADWLRGLLLGWARAHGRDPEMIARAESLLRQPGDSAPHDDHFHIRIACTPEERVRGCRDGGPIWWWLEKLWDKADATPADDASIAALLRDDADDAPPLMESRVEATAAPVRMCLPSLLDLRHPLSRHAIVFGPDAAGEGMACGR